MTLTTAFFAWALGAPELIIILVILLVLFGGAKLPGLAKGLGQSIKEFKKSTRDDEPEEPAIKPEQPAIKPDEPKKTETIRHGTN